MSASPSAFTTSREHFNVHNKSLRIYILFSYTEDKVVLNFNGKRYFALHPRCKTSDTPCYPPNVIVASRFFSVIYNCACDPLLILIVVVIKIKYALQNITVAKV